MTEKSSRTLGWASQDGTMTAICDLDDAHLLNCIALYTRRIMAGKMLTGMTSVSTLVLDYLIQEAKDRGLPVLRPGDSEDASSSTT
jgi:hypothetical protein